MKINQPGISLLLLVLMLLSVVLSGCGSSAISSGKDIPKPEKEVLGSFDASLVGAPNEFGMELLKKIIEEDENIFISPTSIYTALAMTYNGARGETKEAMAEVLGIKDVDLERLNKNNLALLYFLQEADPSVSMHIANSLWMREGVEFHPEFVKRNENYYNASVRELDFNDPKAADIINSWVNDRTKGLIEDIVEPPIDPFTILFLINAIYFQGDWSEPFDPQNTRDDIFHLPGGETKKTPFMSNSGEFDYYEEEGFQAVRLPYGKKETMAMYIFLPTEDEGLLNFIDDIDNETWQQWHRSFQVNEGSLQIPRFSMEYEKSLNDVLKALGMEIAFDEGKADLLDMVPWEGSPNLYISEVKHKAFIEVDEKGTEAAAVTSVEIRTESAPAFYFNMKVDRPFFFLIHEEETDAILFMGTVMDPS